MLVYVSLEILNHMATEFFHYTVNVYKITEILKMSQHQRSLLSHLAQSKPGQVTLFNHRLPSLSSCTKSYLVQSMY